VTPLHSTLTEVMTIPLGKPFSRIEHEVALVPVVEMPPEPPAFETQSVSFAWNARSGAKSVSVLVPIAGHEVPAKVNRLEGNE
jgi:hypothetical protein